MPEPVLHGRPCTPGRRLPMQRLLPLLLLCTAACSGETSEPQPAGGEPARATASASIGPIGAPAGGEDTYCIHKRLGNDEAGFVRAVSGNLSEGSHHMIVYVSDQQEEQLDPERCGGFDGILVFDDGGLPGLDSANVPVFIAQQSHASLSLPRDPDTDLPIGFHIEKDQMLLIEMHWYNTASTPREVTGEVEVEYLPESSGAEVIESSFAFWGTTVIDIAPQSTYQTPVLFQRALADTKAFAVTTHQHQYGTRMRVWRSDGSASVDGQAPLVEGRDWAEPPLEMLEPPVEFGAGEGLAYQCEWSNTSNRNVSFGEGFDDEMCFLWAYYYPSLGFDICVHFQDGAQQGVCNHLIR